MIALVFSYEVRDVAGFERVYGPDGDWARFFAGRVGYIGTELPARRRDAGRYLVIDRWESADAYNASRPSTARSTCGAWTTRASTTTRSCASARSRTCGRQPRNPAASRSGVLGLRQRPRRHPAAAAASEGLTDYEAWFSSTSAIKQRPGSCTAGSSRRVDEACGLLATWYRFPAVTARIFVRYREPVPINTELLVRARLMASADAGCTWTASWQTAATSSPKPAQRSSTFRSSISSRRRRAARQPTPGARSSTTERGSSRALSQPIDVDNDSGCLRHRTREGAAAC